MPTLRAFLPLFLLDSVRTLWMWRQLHSMTLHASTRIRSRNPPGRTDFCRWFCYWVRPAICNAGEVDAWIGKALEDAIEIEPAEAGAPVIQEHLTVAHRNRSRLRLQYRHSLIAGSLMVRPSSVDVPAADLDSVGTRRRYEICHGRFHQARTSKPRLRGDERESDAGSSVRLDQIIGSRVLCPFYRNCGASK
ncbi:hypothetical protein BKA63DRAFT_127415 [Paraphoma chrysanthemicola]|nr:hypothetical protein BKA63DRAFT_127415 [Paraphoma chrysanthemicola]